MTDEEQKIFDAYVAHRRSMYSWTQFWVVAIPATLICLALFALAVCVIMRHAHAYRDIAWRESSVVSGFRSLDGSER